MTSSDDSDYTWASRKGEDRMPRGLALVGCMHRAFHARDAVSGVELFVRVKRNIGWPKLAAHYRHCAEAMAGLRHPHIVPADCVCGDSGPWLFVADYVAGGSLAQRRFRDPLSLTESVRLMEKVSRAIHYAHERGVLHLDLTPRHVLLDEAGEPRVTDFAVCRPKLQGGEVIGVLGFLAPEQLAKGELTRATDIWAIGVNLFLLLAGFYPFDTQDPAKAYKQIARAAPRCLPRSVPRPVRQIVGRCLQKDPSCRYPTALAVADDLAGWLGGKPPPSSRIARVWRSIGSCFRQPSGRTLVLCG